MIVTFERTPYLHVISRNVFRLCLVLIPIFLISLGPEISNISSGIFRVWVSKPRSVATFVSYVNLIKITQ